VTHNAQHRPFDERAALEELERLADKIQLSRRQRAQAEAEFDAFVKTFRQDRSAAAPVRGAEGAAPVTSSNPPAVPFVHAPMATAAAQVSTMPSVSQAHVGVSQRIAAKEEATIQSQGAAKEWISVAAASEKVPPRFQDNRMVLAVAGILLLALLVWRPWSGPAAPPAAPSQTSAETPVSTTPNQSPAAAAASAPAPARAINIQLTTLRPVWTRVIVDDEKAIEKTLPADQKIPLGADRAIVIRAGDAGAIRITVDGRDIGPLGKDGFPATRTFTTASR
jgi:hypothetical protein